MARTLKGNLTGMAASTHLADLRDQLNTQAQNQIKEIKLDFGDLLSELRELDPHGWGEWYDRHVPDWKDWRQCGPAMEVIRDRIEELKHDPMIAIPAVEVNQRTGIGA